MAAKTARIRGTVAIVLTAWVAGACGSPVLDETAPPAPVVVGAGQTPDDELLAHLYAGALRATAVDVRVLPGQPDLPAALDAAEVTLIPGYTGRLLERYDPGADATDAEDVFEALARAVPDETTISDYASAQDRAVLLAGRELLDRRAVSQVSDLVPHCAELTLVTTDAFVSAGGPEALGNAGCRPAGIRRVDGADIVAAAAEPDTIVGTTGTSSALTDPDPAAPAVTVVDALDRTSREDEPRTDAEVPVFPAQNVVPVFRKGTLGERQLDALRTVAGELTTADLTALRARLDAGEDPETVAREWIDRLG